MKIFRSSLLLFLFVSGVTSVYAKDTVTVFTVDKGDTAWLLISTALVMLMTPGLALFYGGMVRRKNVLGTIMQSFIALGVVSLQWALVGYTLAFGPDKWHFIGDLSWAGLKGVGMTPNPDYAATVPHQAFMIFQMMFAVITPALITGAFAERFKFKTYLLFLLLWSTFVYCPIAHWVWGTGGWLRNMGTLDFAGGLVVHISAGTAALVASIMVGKRRVHLDEITKPNNLAMTLIGAGLLWFGWFGFNAGSALTSGSLATSAFVATHLASAAAVMSWIFIEWSERGRPTALGAASGAIAGLVAITPAAGYVNNMVAILIGLASGIICYYAVGMKDKLGYDDSLDAVGVHGVGSTFGLLMVGFFASKAINPAGSDGLVYGNLNLLGVEAISILATMSYSFIASWIIFKILDKTLGLRLKEEDELEGLDLSQHGESAYTF
ncbi:MAG: ammonium transporter [Ignavibacteriaceae bacterium]